MANRSKRETNGSKDKSKFDEELDALFQLPLSEFIGARNVLATRMKQSGRTDDANFTKALPKPSISAWAVNQLYWSHRDSFDQLLESGQRLRQLQISGLAGKVAEMRATLNTRNKALSYLSDLAAFLLLEAGHNATPDTIRRVATTLESLSSYASVSDGPTLGRLTKDVDPPGFESLSSFGVGSITSQHAENRASKKPRIQPTPAGSVEKVRKLEDVRRAKIATAKASLQDAKKLLAKGQASVQRLDAAKKKADSELKQTEKELRTAQQRLDKARTASENAIEHSESITAQAEEAAEAVEDAMRDVDELTKELESLLNV